MLKNKQLSSKNVPAHRGGTTKMFGKSGSSTQTPGVTSQEGRKAGGGKAVGGSTKMFGKQSVKAATPI